MENDKDTLRGARITFYTLLIGIVVTGFVFGAFGCIFIKPRLPYIFGVTIGTLAACGIAAHLYYTIGKSLDMSEEKAAGYTRGMAVLRLMLMGIPLVAACLLPEYLNVLGVLFGLTGLKIGAFLAPGVLKIIKKFKKEGEREC
ncbi:MAG: ATP synthase subunit I [Lachnospiraceae bacterium]|nr:ATP synthase subunit I [Lachnospiraceae bacterium]